MGVSGSLSAKPSSLHRERKMLGWEIAQAHAHLRLPFLLRKRFLLGSCPNSAFGVRGRSLCGTLAFRSSSGMPARLFFGSTSRFLPGEGDKKKTKGWVLSDGSIRGARASESE